MMLLAPGHSLIRVFALQNSWSLSFIRVCYRGEYGQNAKKEKQTTTTTTTIYTRGLATKQKHICISWCERYFSHCRVVHPPSHIPGIPHPPFCPAEDSLRFVCVATAWLCTSRTKRAKGKKKKNDRPKTTDLQNNKHHPADRSEPPSTYCVHIQS